MPLYSEKQMEQVSCVSLVFIICIGYVLIRRSIRLPEKPAPCGVRAVVYQGSSEAPSWRWIRWTLGLTFGACLAIKALP